MQLGIRTIKVAKQLTSGSIFFFNVKSYQISAFFIENVNLAFSFTPYLAFVDLFFKRFNKRKINHNTKVLTMFSYFSEYFVLVDLDTTC